MPKAKPVSVKRSIRSRANKPKRTQSTPESVETQVGFQLLQTTQVLTLRQPRQPLQTQVLTPGITSTTATETSNTHNADKIILYSRVPMACSKYTSTKETTHAARVSRLLVDPCTDLFRDILRNHVTEVQFPCILVREKKTLNPILNKAQREILYPKSGIFIGTYEAFDLSLLYILLRNISGIKPHHNGWGKTPDSSDRSLSANIDRLREIRNKYCGHASSVSLSIAKFRKLWQDVTVIISELEGSLPLGCTTYTDAARTIKTETMDPEQEEKFLDMIDQQHKTTEDLKEKVQHMEGKTTELSRKQKRSWAAERKLEKECKKQKIVQTKQGCAIKKLQDERKTARIEKLSTSEGENIKEKTLAVLNAQKHKKVNIVTTGETITVDKIKENHIVILTGKAGSGKTTTAYQVMCDMSDPLTDQTYTPVIIQSPEQWDKVVNSSQRYIVFLDDIFGATNLDFEAFDKWKNQLEVICSCAKSWNVLVLMGLRKHILDEARRRYQHAIFDERNEVNLSSEEYFNMKDKERIFKAYHDNCNFINSKPSGSKCSRILKKNESDGKDKLFDYEKKEILSTDPYNGFPLTCFQFFSRPEFFQLGPSFFQRPDEKILEAIEDMRRAKCGKIDDKIKYCVLCYVLINGSIVPNNVSENLLETICEKLRISNILEIDIKDAVNDLDGIFLSKSRTRAFLFYHETILETVMVSFGQLAPEFVIESCNKKNLHELIRTENYEAKPGEVVLKIPRRLFKTLAQKLLSFNDTVSDDILDTIYEVREIMVHPACFDPAFASVFCSCSIPDHLSSKLCRILSNAILFSDLIFRSKVLMMELLERVGPHQTAPVEQSSKLNVRITTGNIKNLLEDLYLYSNYERVLRYILPYICKYRNLHGLINSKVGTLNIFHYCVLHGWEDLVDMILEVYTPTKTTDNWSCVHLAAYAGRLVLLRKFINIGQDVKERTQEGYSALQAALLGLRYGHKRVITSSYSVNSLSKEFLHFQQGVSFPDSDEYENVLKALLAKNTRIQIPDLSKAVDEYENCIIHYLVIHDYTDVLKYLLNYDKEFVLQRNSTCLPTALHVAVYLGRPEMVRELWTLGVRPSTTDLSLRETYYAGKRFSNKVIFNDSLIGGNFYLIYEKNDPSQILWNDGTKKVRNMLLQAIRKVNVKFGSNYEFQSVRKFLSL